MEENNVLWLSMYETNRTGGKSYIFSTDDPDSTDREPFNPIAADLMVELTEGYIPLIRMGYDLVQPSKKRRFLKDIPAKFSESCEAAKWEFLLKKTDWNDGFYAIREYQYKEDQIVDEKELCIMPKSLSQKFLLKMLEDPFYKSAMIIYGISNLPKDKSTFTESDFQDYVQSKDFLIYLSPNQDRTWIDIGLTEYPEEKLVERTKRVAERHGKVLEVYL